MVARKYHVQHYSDFVLIFVSKQTRYPILMYDHDLWKEIKTIVKLLSLFAVIVFNMMKDLAKVKASKTITKMSNKLTNRLNWA